MKIVLRILFTFPWLRSKTLTRPSVEPLAILSLLVGWNLGKKNIGSQDYDTQPSNQWITGMSFILFTLDMYKRYRMFMVISTRKHFYLFDLIKLKKVPKGNTCSMSNLWKHTKIKNLMHVMSSSCDSQYPPIKVPPRRSQNNKKESSPIL